MGLNKDSMGLKASSAELAVKLHTADRVIALAGNPNVGKSTVFNALTGLNQHTGNWPGKTVVNAQGFCHYKDHRYIIVDLPGCYSLMAHSVEEEVARDFICFESPDAVVVVCDATCLERNLNLVIQALEITPNVVVCVNMIDEAKKKNIQVHTQELSELLKVPVVRASARSNQGLDSLMDKVSLILANSTPAFKIAYPGYIETAISEIAPVIEETSISESSPIIKSTAASESVTEINTTVATYINARWLALRLLENDQALISSVKRHLNIEFDKNSLLNSLLDRIKSKLGAKEITEEKVKDDIVQALVREAESIAGKTVVYHNKSYDKKDRRLDKILTSKWAGFPAMFLILMLIFWITITGANYPSQLLSAGLFWIEDRLLDFFAWIHAPEFLTGMLVLGAYRVLAWVVSVMLPPMAIFFPLFTLLEDSGYLPRVAFNLDKVYKKCCACGKQALTMCMVAYMLFPDYMPILF